MFYKLVHQIIAVPYQQTAELDMYVIHISTLTSIQRLIQILIGFTNTIVYRNNLSYDIFACPTVEILREQFTPVVLFTIRYNF